MRDKKITKSAIILGLVVLVSLLVLVVAQTQEELQQELDQLETELSDAGYGKQQEKTMFAGGIK